MDYHITLGDLEVTYRWSLGEECKPYIVEALDTSGYPGEEGIGIVNGIGRDCTEDCKNDPRFTAEFIEAVYERVSAAADLEV